MRQLLLMPLKREADLSGLLRTQDEPALDLKG